MIAVLEACRADLFARRFWATNALAGLIVGIVAIPLAMAFAIASGARPEQGLYTAIVAGLAVSLLGGTRVQIAGPTGAFVVVLSGVTAKYGIAGLQVATLMAGAILVVMGLLRLGAVIRFIPAPVIVGFTAGIALIIFIGQCPGFLGVPRPVGEHFHARLWSLVTSLPHAHLPTLSLALLSLMLVSYTPRIPILKRIPGPLIAMAVATVLQTGFHFQGVATIGTAFGGIPFGLPRLALPSMPIAEVIALIGPAFAIAMLGAIESLLSAVVADGMTGHRHDSNQELVGQGIANLLAPLFGGFAATGALARTATNVRNGGTSPLAGTVHAFTLIAVLLLLAPLASSVPLAAPSAILFVVAWNMSDARHLVKILRTAPTADKVILVVTLLLTVFADLVIAVNVGVLLSLLQFLRRMTDAVTTRRLDDDALRTPLRDLGLPGLPDNVQVYEVTGPLFFGAIESFREALLHASVGSGSLIIRMQQVPFMDATGLQAFGEVARTLRSRGVRVVICEANPRVARKLHNAGIFDAAGEPRCVREFRDALVVTGEFGNDVDAALGW